MTKYILALCGVFCILPAQAAEINNVITDSVQLTVDGPALQTTRVAGQYSVSGSNISVTTLGGWNGDTLSGGAPDLSAGTYSVNTDGQAFSFSETVMPGDGIVTEQTQLSNAGRFDTPNLYGESTTYSGGYAGTLAGSLSPTSVPTVTAGGAGTTAIGQRSVELTVFN